MNYTRPRIKYRPRGGKRNICGIQCRRLTNEQVQLGDILYVWSPLDTFEVYQVVKLDRRSVSLLQIDAHGTVNNTVVKYPGKRGESWSMERNEFSADQFHTLWRPICSRQASDACRVPHYSAHLSASKLRGRQAYRKLDVYQPAPPFLARTRNPLLLLFRAVILGFRDTVRQ